MKKLWVTLVLLLPTLLISQISGPNANGESWEKDPILQLQSSDRDSLLAWQEKVLLHLSDNVVQNRGTIFFKAYLVTGPQRQRYDLSKVLRVELVDKDGAVVKRQYHSLTEGMASGNLKIPKKIKGKHYIKAYTRWMQNYGEAYYAKNVVYIGDQKQEVVSGNTNSMEVKIYPEGGKLVNGLRSRIVIHIDRNQGINQFTSGVIADQNGSVVGRITGFSPELYTAAFTPETGKAYELILADGSAFQIPGAEDEGYQLQVNNLDPYKSRVRVLSSKSVNNSKLRLIGELDGIRYVEKDLNLQSGVSTDFEFFKGGIPRGSMMLKLIDDQDKELSLRPVWIDGAELRIEMIQLVEEQGPEEEYVYQIRVTDKNSNPVQSELALGVSKAESFSNELQAHDQDTNGFDLFTITADTRSGIIDGDRRERFMKDIRLLSEIDGLKQRSNQDIHSLEKINFPFQKGLELAGYAYDMENNLLKKKDIQVMAFSEGQVWVQELKTDAKGRLFLKNLELEGESELVFRTNAENSASKLVKVVPGATVENLSASTLGKKIKKQEKRKVLLPDSWENEDVEGLIDLEEVVINEEPAKTKGMPSLYNIEPTRIKYQDPERPRTIEQLLMDIPGVYVRGIGSINPTVTVMSGYGPILWVIDGAPLSQATPFVSSPTNTSSGAAIGGGSSTSSLIEITSLVPAMDIERIELLSGANAAIFGSRGSGGVFLIYTRTGSDFSRSQRKEAQITFKGYEPELSFEEFRQKELKRSRSQSKTIYWNPNIQTDVNGKATVRFVVPEGEKSLQIQLSTVTKNGKLGLYDALISK